MYIEPERTNLCLDIVLTDLKIDLRVQWSIGNVVRSHARKLVTLDQAAA